MMQSRTHTCGQLRIENAGERVTLVGWMENVRVVGNNFAFIVLRDFYGTTQIVVVISRKSWSIIALRMAAMTLQRRMMLLLTAGLRRSR